MRSYSTEGIVIKSFNIGDADKIYTLFTKDYGKITATAKGVRKITSRRAGNLNTLNLVAVSLHEGLTGHKFISETKVITSFSEIKSNLELSKRAYYLLEFVNKTLEESTEDKYAYENLVNTLKRICEFPENADKFVTLFEFRLLKHLGYEINKSQLVGLTGSQIAKKIRSHVSSSVEDKFKSLEI